MINITVGSVDEALSVMVPMVNEYGERTGSRNGDVIKLPGVTSVAYTQPRCRVLFCEERDANPFFHLFEALWMLEGRNDIAFLVPFVSRMKTFSDDGLTMNGAYGHRWRNHFDRDQLEDIIQELSEKPDSRRAYLGMWDPSLDLGSSSVDIPCNLGAHFQLTVGGKLDMVVFNRSNDILWGMLGANVVHMSMLHEYVAGALGTTPGLYTQVSSNAHVYVDFGPWKKLSGVTSWLDPYNSGGVRALPILSAHLPGGLAEERLAWDRDLHKFFFRRGPSDEYETYWWNEVATPLWLAHGAYRRGDMTGAMNTVQECAAPDWKRACTEWLHRRQNTPSS